MARGDDYYAVRVDLLGHPRITLRDGRRIEIRSKKGLALIGLLATADTGERSRAWLQQKLWGAREVLQAQASLRRELSGLRKCLPDGIAWLKANHRSVTLDFAVVDIDIRRPVSRSRGTGEFLEGIDIPGEEDFEDWLREMRGYYRRITANDAPLVQAVPQADVPLEAEVAIIAARDTTGGDIPDPLLTAVTGTLVDSLSQMRWLAVVAPASDRVAAPRSRYVVETDLVSDARRGLVSLVLTERPHGKVLWSQTSEVSLDAGIAEVRRPLLRAANAMAQIVDRTEQRHRLSSEDSATDLGTLLWRARHHLQKFTSAGMHVAGRLLRQAAQLKPHHGELAMLKAHQAIGALWASRAPLASGGALMPLARSALRGDPTDARGPLFVGILDLWQGDGASARRQFERSAGIAPGFAAAHALLGTAHCLDGHPERGVAPLEEALDLAPIDPFRFIAMGELATARLLLGDTSGCLKLVRDIRTTHPHYVLAQILEVSALASADRLDDAAAAYDRNLRDKAGFAAATLARIPFRDSSFRAALQRGIDIAANSPPMRTACG
ncbi:SARP family transcriptional regulator [Sphingomonas sp.]|uniref:SARP family transcriptional regulator n=1 Tax=Sphingomonas sp. TaxID=28214 RepID=UPI0026004D88|nr:SARP family transcriptional regulator [Sphingomonas sp.]